jgi:hypothetical protein
MGAVVTQTAGRMICDATAIADALPFETRLQRTLTSRRDATNAMTKR